MKKEFLVILLSLIFSLIPLLRKTFCVVLNLRNLFPFLRGQTCHLFSIIDIHKIAHM